MRSIPQPMSGNTLEIVENASPKSSCFLRRVFMTLTLSIALFVGYLGFEFFYTAYESIADMFPEPNMVVPVALTRYLSSPLQCSLDSDTCCITLGPIIGATTATDGRLMIETNVNGPVTVRLVSVSDPYEVHTLSVETYRLTPTLFHFQDLKPAHTYTVHFPNCGYPYPTQPEGGFGLLKTKPSSPDTAISLAVLSCNNMFEEARVRAKREELLHGDVRTVHYRVGGGGAVDVEVVERTAGVEGKKASANVGIDATDINDDTVNVETNAVGTGTRPPRTGAGTTSARDMSRLDTWAALAAEAHTLDGALHLGDQIYADSSSAGSRHHAFGVARRAVVLYLREAYRQALAAVTGVDMVRLARGEGSAGAEGAGMGVGKQARRVECSGGVCAYDVTTVLSPEALTDETWHAAVNALYTSLSFPRAPMLARVTGAWPRECPVVLQESGAWTYGGSGKGGWLRGLHPMLGGDVVSGHVYSQPLPRDTPSPTHVLALVPCPHLLSNEHLFEPNTTPLTRLGPLVPPSLRHAVATAYQHLYQSAWSRPATRLALSRVASVFVLDDHDVFDDLNDVPADADAASLRRVLVDAAMTVYRQYQHTLGTDGDPLAHAAVGVKGVGRTERACASGDGVAAGNTTISTTTNYTHAHTHAHTHASSLPASLAHRGALAAAGYAVSGGNDESWYDKLISTHHLYAAVFPHPELVRLSCGSGDDSVGEAPAQVSASRMDVRWVVPLASTNATRALPPLSLFPIPSTAPSTSLSSPPPPRLLTAPTFSPLVPWRTYHAHVWGNVCVAMLDTRAARDGNRYDHLYTHGDNGGHQDGNHDNTPSLAPTSTSSSDADSNVYLGSAQWRWLHSLLSPSGSFSHCRSLIVTASLPPVFIAPSPNAAIALFHDDMYGHWSGAAFREEQLRLLRVVWAWRASKAGRDAVLIGGDVHATGHTEVFRHVGSIRAAAETGEEAWNEHAQRRESSISAGNVDTGKASPPHASMASALAPIPPTTTATHAHTHPSLSLPQFTVSPVANEGLMQHFAFGLLGFARHHYLLADTAVEAAAPGRVSAAVWRAVGEAEARVRWLVRALVEWVWVGDSVGVWARACARVYAQHVTRVGDVIDNARARTRSAVSALTAVPPQGTSVTRAVLVEGPVAATMVLVRATMDVLEALGKGTTRVWHAALEEATGVQMPLPVAVGGSTSETDSTPGHSTATVADTDARTGNDIVATTTTTSTPSIPSTSSSWFTYRHHGWHNDCSVGVLHLAAPTSPTRPRCVRRQVVRQLWSAWTAPERVAAGMGSATHAATARASAWVHKGLGDPWGLGEEVEAGVWRREEVEGEGCV